MVTIRDALKDVPVRPVRDPLAEATGFHVGRADMDSQDDARVDDFLSSL